MFVSDENWTHGSAYNTTLGIIQGRALLNCSQVFSSIYYLDLCRIPGGLSDD